MERVTAFIHALSWDDIPSDVQHMAARCVLDLSATLIAGSATELSHIIRQIVAVTYGGDDSTLPFDGRRVSAAGAALAAGMTIDAIDGHDGYRLAKGHAGCNVFPAALAIGEKVNWTGKQFMVALVIGYEIALRAAVALHQTACDYHTSGAWGALGAAALAARALQLDAERTAHTLGIAEYHGPRSQMMRCIDHPTMLKDGSGWGSMTGVIAAQLAAEGFSGAPALTVTGSDLAYLWDDLGTQWRIRDLYFKPYVCCRWSQPAVEAVQSLKDLYNLSPADIDRIDIFTFEAATRLALARPANTEQAQYSLPFPVAATLFDGRLDPAQVTAPRIFDEELLALADCVNMHVDDSLEAQFPAKALAQVIVKLKDGRRLESDVHGASGDPDNPLSDAALNDKFERWCQDYLSPERLRVLRDTCWNMTDLGHIGTFVALLYSLSDKTEQD